jgi:hypothetical protein
MEGQNKLKITSGCSWPKATVKSPMGACNLRPLFFIFSYFLLFIFYCPGRPALPLPCPCPCPALFRIFLLLPGTGGGSYTGNGQCFFFLLLPGTGGGSYTLPCKTDRHCNFNILDIRKIRKVKKGKVSISSLVCTIMLNTSV